MRTIVSQRATEVMEREGDALVSDDGDLAARDVEAFLFRLRKECPLVLRELRVVNERVGGVVVLGCMMSLREE